MIDFKHLFYIIQNQPYVLSKSINIDNLESGGILDFFCYDINSFANEIIDFSCKYLINDFEIKFESNDKNTTIINFSSKTDFNFRFVLIQSFPHLENVIVEPNYIYSIIENGESIQHEYNGDQFSIFIPSKTDELILKYIEYIDKYEYIKNSSEINPNILNKFKDQRISFYNKIDIYVKRKPKDLDSFSTNLIFKKRLTVSQIKTLISIMPTPLEKIILRVAKTIYKKYNGRN